MKIQASILTLAAASLLAAAPAPANNGLGRNHVRSGTASSAGIDMTQGGDTQAECLAAHGTLEGLLKSARSAAEAGNKEQTLASLQKAENEIGGMEAKPCHCMGMMHHGMGNGEMHGSGQISGGNSGTAAPYELRGPGDRNKGS